MISSKLVIILSVTVLLVIAFNVAIYFGVKRRKPTGSVQMLGKMAQRARNPWDEDNAKLDELSRQVAELRKADPMDESADDR